MGDRRAIEFTIGESAKPIIRYYICLLPAVSTGYTTRLSGNRFSDGNVAPHTHFEYSKYHSTVRRVRSWDIKINIEWAMQCPQVIMLFLVLIQIRWRQQIYICRSNKREITQVCIWDDVKPVKHKRNTKPSNVNEQIASLYSICSRLVYTAASQPHGSVYSESIKRWDYGCAVWINMDIITYESIALCAERIAAWYY